MPRRMPTSPWRLDELFAAELKSLGLVELFETLEMPLVPVLADMEYEGIHVDPAELDRQRNLLDERAQSLRVALRWHRMPSIPITQALAAVLFNDPKAEPPGSA